MSCTIKINPRQKNVTLETMKKLNPEEIRKTFYNSNSIVI